MSTKMNSLMIFWFAASASSCFGIIFYFLMGLAKFVSIALSIYIALSIIIYGEFFYNIKPRKVSLALHFLFSALGLISFYVINKVLSIISFIESWYIETVGRTYALLFIFTLLGSIFVVLEYKISKRYFKSKKRLYVQKKVGISSKKTFVNLSYNRMIGFQFTLILILAIMKMIFNKEILTIIILSVFAFLAVINSLLGGYYLYSYPFIEYRWRKFFVSFSTVVFILAVTRILW